MGQKIAQQPVDLESQIETLNDIVRKIGDLLTSVGGQEDPGHQSLAEAAPRPHLMPDSGLAVFAHKMYLARRDRETMAPSPGLFHDPAWDILLDVFIAHAQDKFISVTDASLAGQVPVTTALRWVWALEKSGLLERQPDKNDKRRSFVILTSSGLTYMRAALSAMSGRMKPPLFAK